MGARDRRRRLSRQAVRAARVVIARRQYSQTRAAGARPLQAQTVRFGPFVFQMASGELRRGDETIRLTERECEMLRVLATNAGGTVPRQALAGNGEAVSERTVDVQVNRLRRKIETDPANPLIVQTVRGVGYRLVAAL